MKQVDLTNCDREPIHVPGSVQPFGFLLALGADFTICVASENVSAYLGLEHFEIFQRRLSDVFSPRAVQAIGASVDYLASPDAVERMVAASNGYDLPSFANLTTFKTWTEEGPPKGTLYHYPNPHNHQILSIAAAPAPPKIAEQIYTQAIMTKMVVLHMQGQKMEEVLSWAEGEVEGYMRT